MTLVNNILVHPHAISAADLAPISIHLRDSQMSDSLVSNFEDDAETAATEWIVNTNIRNTQEVHLPVDVMDILNNLHKAAIQSLINPFYAIQVRDSEPLQVLHYGVGGHYIPHVDAETLYKDDIGLDMWEKTLDRDLSVVYFLNDHFEGGELVFPNLDLTIKPQAGTLVCFPSDHNYVHGVNPVTAGHRYTLVTWMRVKGTPTPDEINQQNMDEYNRRWPKQIEQRPRVAKGGVSTSRASRPKSS